MRYSTLKLVVALGLAVGLASCTDSAEEEADGPFDGAWGAGKADGFSNSRTYEVLMTAPFCDVCDSGDKDELLKRSAIIQRVVRAIDEAAVRIDVAQFTFSRREIEAALVAAHERGVTVRITIDSGQDRDGSLTRRLRDAGLDVRFIQGAPAGSRFGLLHSKFMIVDGGLLLTGSNNWSSTGTSINNENTIVVTGAGSDPLLVGFGCHFDAIWNSDHAGAGACQNDEAAFTPASAAFKRLRNEIRASQRSVDVLMHHLTDKKLTKELTKAAARGVRVRVLVNEADRAEYDKSLWASFTAAGGQLRYKATNADAYQIMHHKLAIVDDRLLLNGSGNWSGSAFFANFENFVRYAAPEVVDPFVAMFGRLWSWSRTAAAIDAGLTPAQHRVNETTAFLGNLHAHHVATDGDRLLDDGLAEQRDAEGNTIALSVGTSHEESIRHALEYARDKGGMHFMALTPHVIDDRADDARDIPNMSVDGFERIRDVSAKINSESAGRFVALPGMEWSTNSTGNHVNILGSSALCKVERGDFADLYDRFLPERRAAGDRVVVQFNHPRTFSEHEDNLNGSWDQLFDVALSEIPKNGERTKKFNDYGLDDYPPVSDLLDEWLDGSVLPDPTEVDETLANVWAAAAPFVRSMEVTVGRGKDIGHENGQNPSITEDFETGEEMRRTKVHSDWDYYLLRGFRLAPVANQDNHLANWGAGHSSRTGLIADRLDEASLLAALDRREVFASEDQNLDLRLFAEDRVPMGQAMQTRHDSVRLQLHLADPDYTGGYDVTIYRGQIGGEKVETTISVSGLTAGWNELGLELPETGEWFAYVEVHQPGPDRMAWSAPIWIERL